jgi:hypothetical protein
VRVRTVALPTHILKRWDEIAATQLCQRAAELDAENEELQRRLRWAEQLADRWHDHTAPTDIEEVGAEGVTMQVLA